MSEIQTTLSTGQILAKNARLLIAQDQIPGLTPVFKFGLNQNIGTSIATIWTEGGLYQYLTSPSTLTISSTSANDSAAGTGVQSVIVEGLDANNDVFIEEFATNGQIPVTVTTDLFRVFRIAGGDAGSQTVNDGIIYLGTGTVTAGVPANVFATITVGRGQSLMAVFTVPAGHVVKIDTAFAAVAKSSNVEVCLVTRAGPTKTFRTRALYSNFESTISQTLQWAGVLGPGTDMELRANAITGTASVAALVEMLLIKQGTSLGV